MRKRGLEDKLMLGLQSDAWASKVEHQLFKDISGGLPWVVQSHEGFGANWSQMDGSRQHADARHLEDRLPRPASGRSPSRTTMRTAARLRGRPEEPSGLVSAPTWSPSSTVFCASSPATSIGTTWPRQPSPARSAATAAWAQTTGRRSRTSAASARRRHDRYPKSSWHLLTVPESLLASGPKGPVASDELEAYREGLQECEARIAIERALGDEARKARLGADLVPRCEQYLEQRQMMMWLSLSDLQLFYDYPGARWGPSYMASSWRGGSNVGGSHWFLASDWQRRSGRALLPRRRGGGESGSDPIRLVWMVNEIEGYHMRSALTADPIQLIWMVNQIDSYTPSHSLQSPSPSRRVGRTICLLTALGFDRATPLTVVSTPAFARVPHPEIFNWQMRYRGGVIASS